MSSKVASLIIAITLLAVAARSETQRLSFQLDTDIKLDGDMRPTVTFMIREPDSQFGWAGYLKAIVNLRNDTTVKKHVFVAIALFDEHDELLAAGGSSWISSVVIEPDYSMSLNIDFAMAGFEPEDISYFLVNYRVDTKPLLTLR